MDALNKDGQWVTYDGQAENDAFGNGQSDSPHFDAVLADLMVKNQAAYAEYSDWDASYVDAYTTEQYHEFHQLGHSSSPAVKSLNILAVPGGLCAACLSLSTGPVQVPVTSPQQRCRGHVWKPRL